MLVLFKARRHGFRCKRAEMFWNVYQILVFKAPDERGIVRRQFEIKKADECLDCHSPASIYEKKQSVLKTRGLEQGWLTKDTVC